MLNQFLTDHHTDGEGSIMINDEIQVLKNTASLIKSDSEIDFECMKNQILELDAMEQLAEALAGQRVDKAIQILTELTDTAEQILTATIDQLLRVG